MWSRVSSRAASSASASRDAVGDRYVELISHSTKNAQDGSTGDGPWSTSIRLT